MNSKQQAVQGLHRATAQVTLNLHPVMAGDIERGVHEQLDAQLLRYSEDLQGVLISYSGIKLRSREAVLQPYFPFLKVDVKADVVVFKPQVGQHLVGRVNLLGKDFIGLLVLGAFNASIPKDAVRPQLRARALPDTAPQRYVWTHATDAAQEIREGGLVRFRVESTQDQGGLFTLTGSLTEPGTGAADKAGADAAAAAPTKRKRGRQGDEGAGAGGGGGGNKRKRTGDADVAAPAAKPHPSGSAVEGAVSPGKEKGKKDGKKDGKKKRQAEQGTGADAIRDGGERPPPSANGMAAHGAGHRTEHKKKKKKKKGDSGT